MLFHFFTSLIDQYSFLNVFKYLTFRTGLSVITSLIIVFIIGAPLIKIFSEKNWSPKERKNLYLITILFLGATVFWSLFEQAGSTLNIFAEKNTNNQISDFVFPSSWFQSLNPIYIICLAPIFAFFWSRIGEGKISKTKSFL